MQAASRIVALRDSKGLHDSEEAARLLAERAQDLIFRYTVAPQRGFEYVNPAATGLTGYTPEAHYDDPDLWLKLTHAEDRDALVAQLGPESTGGRLTMRWTRKDGVLIWIEQQNVPIYDADGDLIAIEGIARDVTDRKRSEATWLFLQNELLSSISHDLRTPLAAIKASIGVVLANEPPGTSDPLRRMLVNIDSAADELSEMVSNLLELARLQAHEGELHRAWLDLRTPAKRALDYIEPMARRNQQAVVPRLPKAPILAYCDANRVERALCNLLSNARKYAGAGTTIRLTLSRRGAKAIFSIADEGPGLDPSERQQIFERVYGRTQGSRGRRGGSGLGLPVARAVAELHGGRLWVESEPGQGATFRIALPLGPQQASRRAAQPQLGAVSPPPPS